MQSIFRLPWCSEQLKLSEKAALDKMRPAPMVEIPVLSTLKRKFSDSPDAPSLQSMQQPDKKQRADVGEPQQLLTPCSPFLADPRFPANTESPQYAQVAAPVAGLAREVAVPNGDQAWTAGGAQSCDTKLVVSEAHSEQSRADSAPGGYFSRPVQDGSLPAPNTMPDPLTGRTPLQQVIENEFNMQILMKHNELRLIEQELAKCQIALEQLRRCELRPFPGSHGPDLSVSTGTGPAIAPAPGHTRPSHASPYGVTDGPYSRHYRQWLLHDPLFDSMSPQAIAHAEQFASSRPSRNASYVRKSASKSFAASTRAADPLHSIPNYPAPAVKDKNAPLVLRRSTDNKLVKLICNHCKRFNFSSIQGFLNHCRIAHKNDYKSHDAAAIDCGHALDDNEVANLPAETQAISAPKPAPSRRVESVSIAPSKNTSNLVHPLNTPAATPVSTPGPQASPRCKPVATPMPKLQIQTPQSQPSAKFNPATNMPRLSAHFAKHKLGGDLAQAVANAKQKIDFGVDDDSMSPETPEAGSPLVQFAGGKRMHLAGSGTMRPGTHDGNAVQRPESRKGFRQPTQRPRPPPLAPAPARENSFNSTPSAMSSPNEALSAFLSPNPADSNPGLVSDHEDDDHGSGSDEESSHIEVAAPRHPLPPSRRACEDHMDLDVQEDHEMDQHGVLIRRNSMSAEDARGLGSVGSPSRKVGGG